MTVELDIFDKAKALLYKLVSYLVDPRLVVAILAVWQVLKMFGFVQAELSEQDLSATLKVFAGLAVAISEVLTVVAIAWKYLDGVTVRPPRGISPWAEMIKAQKVSKVRG